MPEEMKLKIVDAFLKFVSTKAGQESLHRIYNVKKMIPTTDKDYDGLRKFLMISTLKSKVHYDDIKS
ncbi:hypothetical protein MASR1M107_20900 [Ignavibacteriales bacterium]